MDLDVLLNQENILITNDILHFIQYGFNKEPNANYKRIKSHLVQMLKKHNIPYQILKYNDPLSLEYEYIQNEIKTISKSNLNQKTWIVLGPSALAHDYVHEFPMLSYMVVQISYAKLIENYAGNKD